MNKNIVKVLLLFFVFKSIFADSVNTISAKTDSSLASFDSLSFQVYASAEEKKWKLEALSTELHNKRKIAAIATAVLSSALLFDYAVIQPATRNLDPTDPASGNDQLALMSPGILIFMMKLAGTTMSSMRTSETADAYVDITGAAKPTNISWKLYWAGWGTTLVSGLVSGTSSAPKFSEYKAALSGASLGLHVTADFILLVNGIYSILYTGKIQEKASAIPVKIIPTIGENGAGLSLNVGF